MSESPNPYSAPPIEAKPNEEVASSEPTTLGHTARRTFIAWEKLRLIYNGVLIALTLTVALINVGETLFNLEFWLNCIAGAIGANICFVIGPILETYVNWLRGESKQLRTLLFVAGTLLSALFALAGVLSFAVKLFPMQQ